MLLLRTEPTQRVYMSDLDNISTSILRVLARDPRTPNNAIAKEVGVAEATVAARLRQMRENKIMRVALRKDFHAAGYDFQTTVDITTSGRSVHSVAEELAALDAVKAVMIVMRKPEIIITINTKDRQELAHIISDQISTIRGVAEIETHAVLRIRKSRVRYANLKSKYGD